MNAENSRKKISNTNCCVYECHSRKSVNPSLSFHTFPKSKANFVQITNKLGIVESVDRRKAWELKLLMGKPTTPTMLVCSLHFLKEDFYLADIPTCKPRLRMTAVPSQNLPKKKCYSCKLDPDKYREHNRSGKNVNVRLCSTASTSASSICADSSILGGNCDLGQVDDKWTKDDEDAAEVLLSISNMPPLTSLKETFADVATQVKSGDLLIPFVENICSDSKLSSLTGIPSLKILKYLVTLSEAFCDEKRQRKLSLRERIILTFIKLKTGLKYVVISILFNVVTPNTCKIIFHDTICLLATALKPIIEWPTLQQCKNSLPKCFKNFANVRVVLDCTEIPLAMPKRLCCKLKAYSHYKSRHTIKFMTGVSPAGLITFISLAYGGRASDKIIFEQSGIIKKLTMCTDAVMVDKGFHINEICTSYAIKIIQPPFLYKPKKQLTKEEALLNVEIARARVHIERCNLRIKVFEIFNKPLPFSLLPIINEIFTVTCAVVNLSPSILADDKFF